MAEHYGPRSAGRVLVGYERASEQRPDTKDRKEVRRDPANCNALGRNAGPANDTGCAELRAWCRGGKVRESSGVLLVVAPIVGRHRWQRLAGCPLTDVVPDVEEPIRVVIRQ